MYTINTKIHQAAAHLGAVSTNSITNLECCTRWQPTTVTPLITPTNYIGQQSTARQQPLLQNANSKYCIFRRTAVEMTVQAIASINICHYTPAKQPLFCLLSLSRGQHGTTNSMFAICKIAIINRWAAVVFPTSRGWGKGSASHLPLVYDCDVLCPIMSVQYLPKSSLQRLADLP